MAQFFKRRAKPGINKNDQKVQRGKEAVGRGRAAGSLGYRYPLVERLSVTLDFITPQNQSVDQQTRVFGPLDGCEFSVPCPGRCGCGSYDLAAKIKAVIDAGEKASESSGICKEPLYSGSPDICGLKLQCKIEIRYLPQPVPHLEP
jgi:hypothetical protein